MSIPLFDLYPPVARTDYRVTPQCRECSWEGEPTPDHREAMRILFAHIDREHPEVNIYGDAR